MVSRAFFVVSLLCFLSTSWSTSDEDIHQDKNIKPGYPKKYLPMVLDKFRINPEDSTSSTTEETSTVLNVNKNEEEEVKDIEAIDNEDDNPRTDSERSKKSATTTFCVEIRPSNPYQKPFQVCEPAHISYPPNRPPPNHQPPVHPPAEPPVMVLPHVPVAEPYHVPQPYQPASGGVYRSNGGWGAEAEGGLEGVNGRSSHGGYGYDDVDKVPLYDLHRKKEVKYIPLVTHSYTKSKPFKFLNVLKDLKKDKYGPDYSTNDYYPAPPHDYAAQDSHSSSHGLVITCQPSAVGYTGQQDLATLHKHMQLLQGLYSQSEKLYNQQQLSPLQEGSSGGYVSPPTYRDAGWKGVDGKGEEMVQAPAGAQLSSSASPSSSPDPTARSHGSHGKYGVEDPSMRSSGNSKGPYSAEPSLKSSYGGGSQSGGAGGPSGAEAIRSSGYGGGQGGPYGVDAAMRSSGYGGGAPGGHAGSYGGGGYRMEPGRSAYGGVRGGYGGSGGSGGQYGLEQVAVPMQPTGLTQAEETAKAFIEARNT